MRSSLVAIGLFAAVSASAEEAITPARLEALERRNEELALQNQDLAQRLEDLERRDHDRSRS